MIDRIKSLAIPPAWEDVWICSDPNGHIQATGLDAKGRRQYRYHDEWRAARDREKHDRILRFARRLPALREQVDHDIALDGMPRERVLACAVRLLELGFFRIGGEAYAEENDTYGLATIRKLHVRVAGRPRSSSTTTPRAASTACARSPTTRSAPSSPRCAVARRPRTPSCSPTRTAASGWT